VSNGKPRLGRRDFIKSGAAGGVGAAAVAGMGQFSQNAPSEVPAEWTRTADVVIVGAGASGLPASIMARDEGASVIVIDANHDIGGHGMVSGGIIPLGGGTSLQKKYGIDDSADKVYLDHTDHKNAIGKFCDRDLIRVWADENAQTFEFLIANGVKFIDKTPTRVQGQTVPRSVTTEPYPGDLNLTINGRNGAGLVRHLEKSARTKGVEILLQHKMTRIVRDGSSGRVLGIAATANRREATIQARRGVILATGGHSSNVAFRRMFDPRLTEEYQTAGEPWTQQMADGEIQAMAIGAALWATGNQACENGRAVTKTRHIGCRWGYQNLKWRPESPVFGRARASGLTVSDFQNLILVNQSGQRFWNELDNSYDFINACLGTNGNLGNDGKKANGGGPIWAIFDADAVRREKWDPTPPNVDPEGWFFRADTLAELARKVVNPYQLEPIAGPMLEDTVATYNSHVDAGKDADFERPTPMHKIQTPPFYAAWATPIVHDTLTGLRINAKCQVVDIHGQVIPGLYCAGEAAGGFALHGLPRVLVFGRIAGREAARDRA
jgi:hypothetical protein